MSAGACSVAGGLSFRRIVDIPFKTCVAALESWQRTGQEGGPPIGQILLRGPIQHHRGSGTCQVEVRLARGPLRPQLRMRLLIDRWSSSPPRTALELIPCKLVRPTATYFRAGHLLLDSLTCSLAQHMPAQRFAHATASQPHAHHDAPTPGAPAAGSASAARPVPELTLPNRGPGRDGPGGRHHVGAGTAAHPSRTTGHHIARFMDFHDDLKLPAEAIAQIAEDTRNATADRFGVRQIELYHNPDGKAYCLLEGPDEDAIRQHHAALGMPCGDVHQVNSLT